MPRPTNKDTLLALGAANFEKLFALIDSLNEEQLRGAFQFEHRDRSVRDTLVHLHEWHLMFIRWHDTGMGGEKPEMPARGFTWRTLPDLNLKIWNLYQETSLETSISLLKDSYQQVRTLIKKYSDQELFEKKRYAWTGSTSLGAYCVSATSSHYDWAIKQIRRHQRTFKSPV